MADVPQTQQPLHRLERAVRRVESEMPYSPAWDAAMAELDDAERALRWLEPPPALIDGDLASARIL